jgi:hypothetical protein
VVSDDTHLPGWKRKGKAGHRRRKREEGESRTPQRRADGVICKGTSKTTGKPCKANSIRPNGYCVAHQLQAPDPIPMANGMHFGSPEQVRAAQRDRGSLRFPRLTEVVERELEAKCEEIVNAHLEGLIATRTHVDAKGGEHTVADYDTRWRSAAALLERALGKAASSDETVAGPSVHVDLRLIENPAMRERAQDLLQAISDSRTAGKFGD